MKEALKAGCPVTLDHIDSFVDGAAVRRIGDITYEIGRNVIDRIQLVPEGKICSAILRLYNEDAIVAEPAGRYRGRACRRPVYRGAGRSCR